MACREVNAHVQWFACERYTRSGAVASTTQAISPTTAHCNVFHRGGLRFERYTPPNRDLTASKRGELRYTGTRA